jgi:hypothetical protein
VTCGLKSVGGEGAGELCYRQKGHRCRGKETRQERTQSICRSEKKKNQPTNATKLHAGDEGSAQR